jgi:uncharacterized protein YggU (UPF0235/DUF167 family)
MLRVAVVEAPEDGRANRAVCRLLARALDVPPSSVRVVVGESSREKTVEISNLTPEECRNRLRRLLAPPPLGP